MPTLPRLRTTIVHSTQTLKPMCSAKIEKMRFLRAIRSPVRRPERSSSGSQSSIQRPARGPGRRRRGVHVPTLDAHAHADAASTVVEPPIDSRSEASHGSFVPDGRNRTGRFGTSSRRCPVREPRSTPPRWPMRSPTTDCRDTSSTASRGRSAWPSRRSTPTAAPRRRCSCSRSRPRSSACSARLAARPSGPRPGARARRAPPWPPALLDHAARGPAARACSPTPRVIAPRASRTLVAAAVRRVPDYVEAELRRDLAADGLDATLAPWLARGVVAAAWSLAETRAGERRPSRRALAELAAAAVPVPPPPDAASWPAA